MNHEDKIAPEISAVITAAVAAYLQRPFELRSVRSLAGVPQDDNRWTRQGRSAAHGSHNQVHAPRMPQGRR